MEATYTLVIEKWQVRPEPKWTHHSEQQVICKVTPKQLRIQPGQKYSGKVFNRATGRLARKNYTSWFRYHLVITDQTA